MPLILQDRVTLKTEDKELVLRCMQNAADAIREKVPELNELDQICGDGDCGSTLSRLADGEHCLCLTNLNNVRERGINDNFTLLEGLHTCPKSINY